MDEEHTTIVMERFLGQLARLDGSASVEPIIEGLVDSSVSRLHLLCRTLLVRSYPRLARPPLNLQPEELLHRVIPSGSHYHPTFHGGSERCLQLDKEN